MEIRIITIKMKRTMTPSSWAFITRKENMTNRHEWAQKMFFAHVKVQRQLESSSNKASPFDTNDNLYGPYIGLI
jgi:hypothetical protein